MNGLVAEWVEKAQGDFNVAQRELRVRRASNYDACCFHAQQSFAFVMTYQLPPCQTFSLRLPNLATGGK